MNIYLLSQDINNNYDTYDSVIVIAESEEEARKIHPSEYSTHVENNEWYGTYADKSNGTYPTGSHEWIPYSEINKLSVDLIGTANENQKKGVVLASFNAG